jgi:glucose-6-phosphate 1-epimerase
MQRMELVYDERNTAEVYLNGAHVTSWCSAGEQILFLSEQSRFAEGEPIRGGIPLVFPQFGPGKLPQHGFARNSPWELVSSRIGESGEVEAILSFSDSDATRAVWDHAFRAEFTLTLTESLAIELKVTNLDEGAFDFTAALHTYFAVSDIGSTYISGLKDLEYLDSLENRRRRRQTQEMVTFEGEVDRIYLSTSEKLSVVDEVGGRRIIIHKTGFSDAVVWNPWIDKARRMDDFGDEEYTKMVCVEAGAIASPVHLEKGRSWRGYQSLELGRR